MDCKYKRRVYHRTSILFLIVLFSLIVSFLLTLLPFLLLAFHYFVRYRPLENDISTWNYELVATDSGGLNVSDILDVHVQQHRLSRIVNHEFSIYLKIDKRNLFPTDVDWELQVFNDITDDIANRNAYSITTRSRLLEVWPNYTVMRIHIISRYELSTSITIKLSLLG